MKTIPLPNDAPALPPEQECGPSFTLGNDALGRLIADLDKAFQPLTLSEIVSYIVFTLKGKK